MKIQGPEFEPDLHPWFIVMMLLLLLGTGVVVLMFRVLVG